MTGAKSKLGCYIDHEALSHWHSMPIDQPASAQGSTIGLEVRILIVQVPAGLETNLELSQTSSILAREIAALMTII